MIGRLIDDAFLDRLQTFAMATKTSMRGYFGGTHRTAGYGSTVEFAEYREYVPGDDIRRVDWNLYGRFERFFIKLFADERQMHNRILIDTSASMAKADPAKAEYALRLAAAMGYLSVLGMDKVSFGMLDGNACQDLAGTVVGKEAFFGALERMEEHFQEKDTVAQWALLCEMSEVHFRRVFRDYTGQGPVEYRNRLRLERARELLQSGEYNVSEAAFACGFSNLSFFIRLYKKRFGNTPKQE